MPKFLSFAFRKDEYVSLEVEGGKNFTSVEEDKPAMGEGGGGVRMRALQHPVCMTAILQNH